ncbi:hypothetical protein [Bradyrhizobium sp. sBnM-33]|jgi:hypothetical protein|uniref:hypothetical protein n=1 Tax=Bradyrhizobium sp. sBnM-33 TaxID=2831780 RepID=UPI001BCC12C3|nr:hypothetical protein [Bradyrhizobium sp. sBnM-33]WOH53780.1 hypothetical protein RX328_17820 [Bradyrhizobium sp. sBnM-33]
MAIINNKEVEAEVRRLLREQVERSDWFRHGMTRRQRRKHIDREVDAWWHLKLSEAAQRLVEREVQKD